MMTQSFVASEAVKPNPYKNCPAFGGKDEVQGVKYSRYNPQARLFTEEVKWSGFPSDGNIETFDFFVQILQKGTMFALWSLTTEQLEKLTGC